MRGSRHVRLFAWCMLSLCIVAWYQPSLRASSFPIYLQASNGNYLVAESGGNDVINADRTSPGAWETFTLIDINGGSLEDGDFIHLETSGGYYVGATGGGGGGAGQLHAFATVAGAFQTFQIRKISGSGTIGNGDPVWFYTSHYWVLCAEGGGGSTVHSNRVAPPGAWETFTITM